MFGKVGKGNQYKLVLGWPGTACFKRCKPIDFHVRHFYNFSWEEIFMLQVQYLTVKTNVLILTFENKILGMIYSLYRGRQNIFLAILVLNLV